MRYSTLARILQSLPLTYMKMKLLNWPWKFSPFLSDYYHFVSCRPSQLFYISYVFIKFSTFFTFFLSFHVFSSYPVSLYFFPLSDCFPISFCGFCLFSAAYLRIYAKEFAHFKNIIHEESLYF